MTGYEKSPDYGFPPPTKWGAALLIVGVIALPLGFKVLAAAIDGLASAAFHAVWAWITGR